MKEKTKEKMRALCCLKIWILVCMTCLAIVIPVRAAVDGAASVSGPAAATPGASVTPTPAKPKKTGWETLKNGKRRYYRDGRYVTGVVSVGQRQYFFDRNGYLRKNAWGIVGKRSYRTDRYGRIIKDELIKVKSRVYYVDKKGVVKKNGWKTFRSGRMYFGASGIRVTGLKKIGKKQYYFSKKGIMLRKRWKNLKSGRSYFKGDGSRAVGLTKIGKDRYYFNSRGVMQRGTTKVKSTTYYLDEKGVLQARKKGARYYHADGSAMDDVQALDLETFLRAKEIVGRITTPQMSRSQKLKTCFDWVISKPYVTRRVFSNFRGWPAVYANDHFILKGGNCQSDASAFAYMAKALGYRDIYVCADSDGTAGLAHSWAEIGGLVYDPLFAEAKSYSGNYGVPYGVYRLHPILHIAV